MKTKAYNYTDINEMTNTLSAFWKSLGAEENAEKTAKWKEGIEIYEASAKATNTVIFLFDFSTFSYFYVSGNAPEIINHRPEEFYENGVALSVNLIHPKYLEARLKMLEFYIKLPIDFPEEERKELLISLDFMFINPKEEYVRFVQQSKILELDTNGKPLISLNYLHNVGSVKKEPSSDLIVKPGKGMAEIYHYNFDRKVIDAVGKISKREKDILTCLSQGFSTGQIAEKLYISPNTVNTHRSNLLFKTNCKDTSSLIFYAKMTGLM